jgi:hypothetical protein
MSNGDSTGTIPQFSFSCRVDRPIQGCELTPNPFLQLKGTLLERPRMVDPNIYTLAFHWKRGPKKPACVNPYCTRANSFEPTQWSKAALGGPELICNVCTTAGFPPHESSFCSRK